MVNRTTSTEDNFAEIYKWDSFLPWDTFLWELIFKMKGFVIPFLPRGARHLPRQSNTSSMHTHHSGGTFATDNLMQVRFDILLNNPPPFFTPVYYCVENYFKDFKLFFPPSFQRIKSTGSLISAWGDESFPRFSKPQVIILWDYSRLFPT